MQSQYIASELLLGGTYAITIYSKSIIIRWHLCNHNIASELLLGGTYAITIYSK